MGFGTRSVSRLHCEFCSRLELPQALTQQRTTGEERFREFQRHTCFTGTSPLAENNPLHQRWGHDTKGRSEQRHGGDGRAQCTETHRGDFDNEANTYLFLIIFPFSSYSFLPISSPGTGHKQAPIKPGPQRAKLRPCIKTDNVVTRYSRCLCYSAHRSVPCHFSQ